MADLGSIGVTTGLAHHAYLHGGVISGLVHDANGDPVRHRVLSFSRQTGQPSGGAYSSAVDGGYEILVAVNTQSDEHFVVEFDHGTNYNARVFDRVLPL